MNIRSIDNLFTTATPWRRSCRACTFAILLLFMVTSPALGQTKVIAGPMLGHITDASARLWMQLNTSEDVSVQIVDLMTNRPLGTVRVTELESPFVFDTPLPGLAPNRSYRIEVLFDGKPVDMPDPPVLIRTAPPPGEPTDFTVAFGSSMSPSAFPRLPVMKAIVAEKPRAFLSLGNFGYLPADAKAWPKTRREAARLFSAFQANVRGTPDLQPLFRTTPVYAIWSEHDYGPTGADGAFPFAREALTTFMRFWPNPDYGTPDALGVYHTFTLGDVDFFMLDDHTYRRPPPSPSPPPPPRPALRRHRRSPAPPPTANRFPRSTASLSSPGSKRSSRPPKPPSRSLPAAAPSSRRPPILIIGAAIPPNALRSSRGSLRITSPA